MAADQDAESLDLRVFISYRRSDCQPQANGLNDGLRHRLPGARVFMDIDSIPFGVDFEQHIREEIRSCDVVLVLIGDQWLDVRDAAGQRRVEDPQDFVRLEIENALASSRVRVVPVLVEDAAMPPVSALPASIARLARLSAIELSDRRWQADLERLADVVEQIGTDARAAGWPAASTVRLDQLDAGALRAAVGAMPQTFQTKDVSEQAAASHGDLAEARNYHAMVGSWILSNAAVLNVHSVVKSSNGRGERWARSARAPGPDAPTISSVDLRTSYQPQQIIRPATPPPAPLGQVPVGRAPSVGERAVQVFMILLPVLSFSFAAWVPPLWAAAKRRQLDDRGRTKRLHQYAGLITALLVLFVIMLAVPPPRKRDPPRRASPWLVSSPSSGR